MAEAPRRPADPPLNALRAFESAARLGGFAAAAEELFVTPGAVAQHVKALERWAGAPLFERLAQGVRLTALGRTVAGPLAAAFDQLGEAAQALRAGATPATLHVAVLPSVGQLWLAPRLAAVRAAVPGLTISVTALEQPPNLRREQFDLALFYRDGAPGPDDVVLAEDVVVPVCAPELAGRLLTPADLGHVPLLHDATWATDWERWLAAAAPTIELDTRGPTFSLYGLAVAEAVAGGGVLVGHEALVADHLRDGTLVAPFADRVTLPSRLVLTLRPVAQADDVLTRVVATLSGAR